MKFGERNCIYFNEIIFLMFHHLHGRFSLNFNLTAPMLVSDLNFDMCSDTLTTLI